MFAKWKMRKRSKPMDEPHEGRIGNKVLESGHHERALFATSEKRPCLLITSPIRAEAHRTFVVLGVERGGTSMVAGVIRALGINMGATAGLNHEDPRFVSDDLDRQRKIIHQNNRQLDVWGFKMPKASLNLDFYAETLRNPYYIVVYRNIAAIADSWDQRGTGTYVGSIDRAVRYYAAISDFLQKTKRPVLVVNYERAAEKKVQTVTDIAEFLGVEPESSMIERCAEMITGDGKGYVNLPEHHFRVSPASAEDLVPPGESGIDVTSNADDITEPDGWISFEKTDKRAVFIRPGEAAFPVRFWIDLDIDTSDNVNLDEDPVHICFNYTGRYFAGHCARPQIHKGRNRLFVETSGKARGVAIGSVRPGIRMKISARFHEALPVSEGEKSASISAGA